jgi:hypothetical protein
MKASMIGIAVECVHGFVVPAIGALLCLILQATVK